MKGRFQKLPKWLRFVLWIVGVLVGLMLIVMIALKIWLSTWKTYKNDDFGFSVRYPASWYISPNIISKDKFDKGQYPHGDFMGFIFNIDSKKGPLYDSSGRYTPSPGDVEVLFYKKTPLDIRAGRNPMETDNYVFKLQSPYGIGISGSDFGSRILAIYYHWIGSKIIDSFMFTK